MVHIDKTGKTTFRFRHCARGPVYVVGDFCHWQHDHLPMRQVGEHEWVLMLRLPPGTYEFRDLAAGKWFTDYAAFGVCKNAVGEFNSVLRIPKVVAAPRRHVRVRQPRNRRLARSA